MADDYQPLENRAREEPDPLSKQQVNQALMDIEDNHPLKERAKCSHIVPFCAPCCKLKKDKPNFKFALRKSLMQEMNMKVPSSEEQLVTDPFLILGYGINAYFDMMKELSLMFLTITLFFIPVYMWYKANPQQTLETSSPNPFAQLKQFSLGNIGGSQVVCNQKKINAKQLSFECPPGTEIDYSNAIYGIMSKKLDLSYYCSEDAIRASRTNDKVDKCTGMMNLEFMHNQLQECKAKFKENPEENTGCSLKLDYDQIYSRTSDHCDDEGIFYIQTPCIIPDKADLAGKSLKEREFTNKEIRQIFGLMVGCLAVFVYMFVVIYIDYIKQVQKNKFVDFDVKTITAGDYTVEFDIDETIYNKWKDHYHMGVNPISEMAQFKIYVQTKLEERISAMPDLGFDGPWEGPGEKRIKIAQITFAFFNEKVIHSLKKRGTFIKTEKWEKLDEINDQIDDSLKDADLLNKLQTPCSVFATFETEEGYNRAIEMHDMLKKKALPPSFGRLLGGDIELQPASEPTDIIWENRHFKPAQRQAKRCIVYLIIVILLGISGTIIYFCSSTSTGLKTKYPKTKCTSVAKDYGIPFGKITEELAKKDQIFDPKQLQKDAFREFIQQDALEQKDEKTHYTDVLQCFCKFEKANKVDKEQTYKNPDDPNAEPVPICKMYFSDVATGKKLSLLITIIIIAFNTILKKVIIGLITWVGEDTYSQRLASITNGVFFAQFFNTGFLLVLVNANLTEHQPKVVTHFLKGKHYDYGPAWYDEVGAKIVQTMFINAFIMPFVGLATTTIIPALKRMKDGGSKNPYKTKKTSMANFKMLYSGADYVIHFKYSNMLNIAYVTMLYGVGLPALFPIAAINYLNQYMVERLIVARYMKQPAALDDKLTQNCVSMLRFAPLLFLVNGYWMLSNQQIFMNIWQFIPDASEPMISKHFVQLQITWATPIMTFALYAIALWIIQKAAGELLAKWGFAMSEKEINVDEDLPNFFKSVKLSHADELISENKNMIDNYGFEPNDPDTIEVLDATVVPKKAVQGTPWYQITSNFLYEDAFNYIGAFVPEREKLIEDGYADEYEDEKKTQMTEQCMRGRHEQSDMVMVLINLAYIPDEVAKKINFKPGWSKEFKANMDQYKIHFKQDTGKVWEFQNKRLEDEYTDFIQSQEAIDRDYIKERTADAINSKYTEILTKVQAHKKENFKKHGLSLN